MDKEKALKRFLRVTLTLAATAAVLALLRLFLPDIVLNVVNRALSKAFTADASIAAIDMQLARGRFDIRDIRIEQPPRFGDDVLLHVAGIAVTVRPWSLVIPPVRIATVLISNVVVHAVINKNHTMNMTALVAKRERRAPFYIPTLIEHMSITNVSVTYTDHSFRKELTLRIADIHVLATNLLLHPSRATEPVLPGGALLTGHIDQAPLSNAPFAAYARIGIMNPPGTPPVVAEFRLGGLELATLAAATPPGTARMLGGDLMDVRAELAMTDAFLHCAVRINTAGDKLSFRVGGTPRKPDIDKTGTFFHALEFAGGGLGRVAGGAGRKGGQIATATVSALTAAGRSAGKIFGALGKGIVRTAKGIARHDGKVASEGLQSAIGDTLTTAAGAAGEATQEFRKEHREARAREIERRKKRAKDWRDKRLARWEEDCARARTRVPKLPFPDGRRRRGTSRKNKQEGKPIPAPDTPE